MCLDCRKLLLSLDLYDLRKSGDKWPKFKETGTKKNQIGESGGERKKDPCANPAGPRACFTLQSRVMYIVLLLTLSLVRNILLHT